MKSYRAIADTMATDIASGRLSPGERLPPHREFAYRHGIANSTASRVYRELVRRGLVSGEVGRGTFVRVGPAPLFPALAEPARAPIDMELNFPTVPEQPALLARSLSGLLRRSPELGASFAAIGAHGSPAARQIASGFLAQDGWHPSASDILFAGNGRQALAAAFAALVPPGERLGVEPLTYPVVKGLAARLGIVLVPLAMDEVGVRPDAVEAAHRASPLRAVYLQPTLHNPIGVSMTDRRRAEIAALLRRLDLFAIEDRVYAFLADGVTPLAGHAPDRTIVIDSLSKRLSPGLTLGFIVAPTGMGDRVAAALRSGAWAASGFALAAGSRWIADGTVAAIVDAKRKDAALRQRVAQDRLAGLDVRGDPRAYHCWLTLPEAWRAEEFTAAAGRRGIAITPAAAFATAPGHAPNAVRLALASPPVDVLTSALGSLATLARSTREAWATE
ncbi:MAG TPA: PLP-dependent aminotransferase family protein [Aliidongia sp.]|uniref:aminotransferase-like domain-containing protein n=1 Tax=Aliidongia sp. TaxID=1914230 RepID=UPI002DDD0CFD|nr:PLP-dependent aminotransferase family protein [Aliidongia sp.]HEV2675408.1 PLP-dependent aminotransferase family protein [Aliidongia sp.]